MRTNLIWEKERKKKKDKNLTLGHLIGTTGLKALILSHDYPFTLSFLVSMLSPLSLSLSHSRFLLWIAHMLNWALTLDRKSSSSFLPPVSLSNSHSLSLTSHLTLFWSELSRGFFFLFFACVSLSTLSFFLSFFFFLFFFFAHVCFDVAHCCGPNSVLYIYIYLYIIVININYVQRYLNTPKINN